MINKGIILAGGFGTRMSPLTKAVNKQLLPIYDKPLVYYPLSVLMLAGIKNILIIVNKGQTKEFKKVLSNGERFGVKLSYKEQSYPRGLPEAFILGEKFIGKDNVALILGDNFFYGQNLTKNLIKCRKLKNGAEVFLHPVSNPSLYGVAKINKSNKIQKIIEKPKKTFSNLAITGLYFFDNNSIKFSKSLKPSKRKELEIVDLLNKYKNKNKLKANFLGGYLATKKKVIESLEKFSLEKTMMIVTHRNPILSMVDRVFVIENGKIITDQTPQQLGIKKASSK